MPRMEQGETGFRAKLADEAGSVRGWLTRYFRRRVQNIAEIEDMVQDVFARIVARDSTEPVDQLGGYVMKTASSVFTDWVRRRSTHAASRHVDFEPELHAEEAADPERIVGGKEELQAVTRVLLQLPERTRTVFILRRLEGQRFQEIAAHLGISVSAVEKHMVRAVHQLSLEMEKRSGS
jgi:RNA polymerase sigma factor (sigma-70 family)